MNISSATATFDRADKTIHFEHAVEATRGSQTIAADGAVAHLTDDEERLRAIELRGNSRIGGTQGGVGGLRSLTGRDVDLRYGPDGQAIEHAHIVGGAVIQLAGETEQTGRRVSGDSIDLSLAPDGSTPTALTAREQRATALSGRSAPAARRTINAQTLDGTGDAQHGLTGAHFEGAVHYREQGPALDRRATSQVLDVALGPGHELHRRGAVLPRGAISTTASMAATAAGALATFWVQASSI